MKIQGGLQRGEAMNEFCHIGDILQQSLKACREESPDTLSVLLNSWREAVGPDVSENTRPAGIRKHMLLVYVTSPVWIHHLHFSKQSIIRRLNDRLETLQITDIRFRIGPV
jgi:hypothetical protein